MSDVKYPDVEVQLSGEDGNAFMILGRVSSALRRAGISKDERDALAEQVFACESYDAVLQLIMRTVATR